MADFRKWRESGSLPSVMTVEEVAGALRVSKQLVYRMIIEKQLPSVRIRRQYRIPSVAIEALLNGEAAGNDGLYGNVSAIVAAG